MKLSRLESTTQSPVREAGERVRHAADEQVRRVEAAEGIEGDRQRSLQQEIAEVDPRAIGPFEGGDQVLADARAVAAQLSLLGAAADELLRQPAQTPEFHQVDDTA